MLLILVTIFIAFGIIRDIAMFSRWLESWMRNKGNGDPKAPASVEHLTALLKANSDQLALAVRESIDRHFSAVLKESKITNDLLRDFLRAQRFIAKTVHHIDLDI